MSATVCETALHSHTHHDEQTHTQPGRYLWPSFSSLRTSSSRSKSRPSALRVVTSETTPTPITKSPSASAEPIVPAPGRLNSSERRRQSVTSTVDSPSTSIPSICRTPSSYSGSEYFPTAPSSAGPATPVHAATVLPQARKSESSLYPVLESLERSSMFCVQTACATCGKHGSNFPCCPRCGEMWCSRSCRLQRGNGKRHICSKSG
ncbi:hypothetical protein BV20DRAFT_98943 [Pilatotrama ljubarskyi]|nr:hypothetical protein BV20DRAFT_98943 [Pilatotrama ljubarskyi]